MHRSSTWEKVPRSGGWCQRMTKKSDYQKPKLVRHGSVVKLTEDMQRTFVRTGEVVSGRGEVGAPAVS